MPITLPEFAFQFHRLFAVGPAAEPILPPRDKYFIENDAIVFGILAVILAVIFKTSSSNNNFFKTFYKIVPMLLLCYFIPSLLTTFGLVNPEKSEVYFVASRYLLPASLILLTLSIDFREILKLGPKALIMFLTGTAGVIIGGPLAILLTSFFSPETVGGEDSMAVWRGFATVAGSWIGGGANQVAMYEIYKPDKDLYSIMITVDVIIAEIWMMFLLLGVGKADLIDRIFKADNSAIKNLQDKMEKFSLGSARIAMAVDLVMLLGICFGLTALSHWLADAVAPWMEANVPNADKFSLNSSFFWLIVLATTFGLTLSFTRVRNYEGVGASKVGTVFIFILVATIGMKMDIRAVFSSPGLFLVGAIWMMIHVALLVLVAWFIKSPYFYLAVGSKANIGGAASAPVVAAAFHPSLAPVGVLLAVLGYALGTYGAWLCAIIMRAASPEGS